MKPKILQTTFFDRPVLKVCPELLGKYLVISRKGKEHAYKITEIEAYEGEQDMASHARFGKTTRNAPMFGHPGYRYVYLVYWMYRMLNIVTWPGKHPSAILLRGIEGFKGPGKITKHLKVDKSYNDKPADQTTWLRIEDWGEKATPITAKRIGIDYAWERAHKEWRFLLEE